MDVAYGVLEGDDPDRDLAWLASQVGGSASSTASSTRGSPASNRRSGSPRTCGCPTSSRTR